MHKDCKDCQGCQGCEQCEFLLCGLAVPGKKCDRDIPNDKEITLFLPTYPLEEEVDNDGIGYF